MGRRKIEIQPITNERNRSVTFLKRKNGLFKKAHELGVLCSVDVAVIIFDERHGHDTKLFQYSSSDVRELVQRHLRHNGERDTRGPADFSGEGGARNDAGGDGDDDDDEGDAEEAAPPPPKRTSAASKQSKDNEEFKPSARVITEAEPKQRASVSNERSAPERTRSNSALPTFSPLPHIPAFEHQHPVSSDRLHPRPYQDLPQSKRQRLDYSLDMNIPRDHGHPLSASEESAHRAHEMYMYSNFRRSSEASHHHPSYPYYGGGIPYPSSPPPSHHGHGHGYGPPPFHSPPSEFALGPQISSWGRTHGPGGGPGAAFSAFLGGPEGHMGPGFDSLPFVRGNDVREGGHSDKNGRDSFAHAFLEAEQQRKVSLPQSGMSMTRGSTSAASAFGLDWPTHRASSLPHPGAPPTPPAPPPKADSRPEQTGNGNGNSGSDPGSDGWLELLSSGAAPNTLTGSSETPIPTPRSSSAAPSASGTT